MKHQIQSKLELLNNYVSAVDDPPAERRWTSIWCNNTKKKKTVLLLFLVKKFLWLVTKDQTPADNINDQLRCIHNSAPYKGQRRYLVSSSADSPNDYQWVKTAICQLFGRHTWGHNDPYAVSHSSTARYGHPAHGPRHGNRLTCFPRALAFLSFPGSHQIRVCDPSTCCYCCWSPLAG